MYHLGPKLRPGSVKDNDQDRGAVGIPFKGKVNVDIRDSVQDWDPFAPPRAPDGGPNVIYIVLDDVGFSAMSCYGGPIDTPEHRPARR